LCTSCPDLTSCKNPDRKGTVSPTSYTNPVKKSNKYWTIIHIFVNYARDHALGTAEEKKHLDYPKTGNNMQDYIQFLEIIRRISPPFF
jgi:hypothetical protein